MKRPLPPFGREVSQILIDPAELQTCPGCNAGRGTIWIATGPGAWDWKYRHPHLLVAVMPNGGNPNSYDWGFLCGHEPPLILPPVSNDQEKCIELATAMMRDGVLSVLAVRKSRSMRFLRKAA